MRCTSFGLEAFNDTLRQELAPHGMWFCPNSLTLDYDEFRDVVAKETLAEFWIVDGNYQSRVKGLTLQRADTIIWLNLPFSTVYRRLFYRKLFDNPLYADKLLEFLDAGTLDQWLKCLPEKG